MDSLFRKIGGKGEKKRSKPKAESDENNRLKLKKTQKSGKGEKPGQIKNRNFRRKQSVKTESRNRRKK
jgi:hypothetical protein